MIFLVNKLIALRQFKPTLSWLSIAFKEIAFHCSNVPYPYWNSHVFLTKYF